MSPLTNSVNIFETRSKFPDIISSPSRFNKAKKLSLYNGLNSMVLYSSCYFFNSNYFPMNFKRKHGS